MVARQHPGEAMAEWFMEGFLDRLTDPHDAASMRVLEHAVFYVVSAWPIACLGHCCRNLSCPPLLWSPHPLPSWDHKGSVPPRITRAQLLDNS